MAIPSIQWTSTGLILPQESEILANILADENSAAGGNLNINNLETPQGQLASSLTAIVGEKNDEIAHIVNQIDPDYADGSFQDAIARIYYIYRKSAVATEVTVTCIGVMDAVIPVGALISDSSGNFYSCVDGGTIPFSGTIDLLFACTVPGAIYAPANTVTQIYTSVSGWDSVNNSVDGVIGSPVESRADFEYRRKNTVYAGSSGCNAAIMAAVINVPDVTDCYVIDNPDDNSNVFGVTNYSIAPYATYVCATGGTDYDVAFAAWSKRNPGSPWAGNTSVTVYDTAEYYSPPYPAYLVHINRPDPLPVYFSVSIVNSASLPAGVANLIKAAIISSFTGTDGGTKERIAKKVVAGRYYATVQAISTANLQVLQILIGTAASPTGTSVFVGIDQYPTVTEDNITVTLV